MTPTTRARLGLNPLPPHQAARVQAQHAALCAGQGARWPAGMHHLAAPHLAQAAQPAPVTEPPLTIAETDDLARGINRINTQRQRRIDAGVNLLVALILGVAGGLMLVSLLTPCEAGHLCTLAAVPLRPSWHRRLQTALRAAYLRTLIRAAEHDLAGHEVDLVAARAEVLTLPMQIRVDQAHIDVLRVQLLDCETGR